MLISSQLRSVLPIETSCPPPDPLVRCPFNKDHVFTKSRLQHHIIKCAKNYPNHFVCPYNALHCFLTKAELTTHILCCPDVNFVLSWKYFKPEKHGDIKETPYHYENARAFNKELENWESEYE